MATPLRVLMIEDSEDDAELALYHLEKAGFSVINQRVETAEAMQAALGQPGWDIILSDYSLPRFSAPSALAVLQKSGLDIPLIIVSGTIAEETAIELLRSGAADYLMKDRLARLGALVRRELGIAQTRKERDETRAALQKSQDSSDLHLAERHKVEGELRRWAQIFQNAGWGITIGSPDGKSIESMNPAFAEMHGYRMEEIQGWPIADFFAPECRQDIAGNIQLAHQIGHHIWESRHIHRDGHTFPVQIDVTTVRNEAGQVEYRVVNVQDITERKQVEESLRLSEEKFSNAFRVSPDSININRLRDGMFIETNEGFKSLTGYTDEDVIGKTSLEINLWANPADRDRLVQGLRAKGAVTNLEAPFRTKDGSIKICLMSARVIEINGEACILSITRDITDRRLKEREYTTFIQTSFDGFWCMDETGHFLDVNDALCQMLGYTREELLKMTVADIEVSESPAEIAAHMQKLIQAGNDRFQTRHRRKDGAIIDVEISAQFIAVGRWFYVFIHDISERKKVADQLNDQLEELRRWHAVTLGREKRILELKGEVNQLLMNAGLPARYASAQENKIFI